MIKVLKYPLKAGLNTITAGPLAGGATVADQGGTITLWVPVSVNRPAREYQIMVIVTGAPLPEGDWHYLGTCLQNGGGFVTHAFIKLTE